jgi:hypothetical protein
MSFNSAGKNATLDLSPENYVFNHEARQMLRINQRAQTKKIQNEYVNLLQAFDVIIVGFSTRIGKGETIKQKNKIPSVILA